MLRNNLSRKSGILHILLSVSISSVHGCLLEPICSSTKTLQSKKIIHTLVSTHVYVKYGQTQNWFKFLNNHCLSISEPNMGWNNPGFSVLPGMWHCWTVHLDITSFFKLGIHSYSLAVLWACREIIRPNDSHGIRAYIITDLPLCLRVGNKDCGLKRRLSPNINPCRCRKSAER